MQYHGHQKDAGATIVGVNPYQHILKMTTVFRGKVRTS